MSRLNIIGNGGSAPVVIRPVLEESEQASAIVASCEALHEIQVLTDEADRYTDLAVGLENLAAVVASIESATTIEMGLIDVAGDLAMAGSVHTGAVLTPGLESCQGQTVSVEGLKTIAQDIWKAIKDFVKKVWKNVETFFHKIFGTLPRLRKSLVALKERADANADKSIGESKTEIGSAANAVSTGYVPPKNGKSIIDTLTTSRDVVNALFDTYTLSVIKRGEAIKGGLKEYKPAKEWTVDQHASALTAIHSWDSDWDKIKKAFGAKELTTKDRRFNENLTVASLPLAGNMSLFVQETASEDGTAALTKAEQARQRTVRVMATNERAQDAIDEHEIDTLTVGDIKAAIDVCIDIVDGVEAWERGKNIVTVKKIVGEIDKLGEALKKNEEKLDDVSSEIRAYPKSALDFVKSFTTWSAEPHTSITGNALAAVRATTTICSKSLSNYK